MPAAPRLPVLAVAALCGALAAAPAAGAKGIARVAVCGAAGCVDRTDVALGQSSEPHLLLGAGAAVSPDAVMPEPYVRVRFGIGDGTSRRVYGRYTVAFLPQSGHLRSEDGTWGLLEGDALRAMRRVVAGVPRSRAAGLHLPAARAATITPAAHAPGTPAVAAASPGRGATRPCWPARRASPRCWRPAAPWRSTGGGRPADRRCRPRT